MVNQEPNRKNNNKQLEENSQDNRESKEEKGCLEIAVIGLLVLIGGVALVFGICLATF